MSSRYTALSTLLVVTITIAGCGRTPDDASATPALELPADPWAMPPESLFGATAAENLRVRPVELELQGVPRGWDGMRIAVLSDLNLGYWPDNAAVAEAAVRRAAELEPDLVVLLGDLVTAGVDAAALTQVLGPLRDRPTLAVLGDRELEEPARAEAVVAALEGAGVTVLRNAAVAFTRGQDTAFVVGIEPEFAAFTAAQQAQLFDALPEGARTPLLLSHVPTVLPRLTEQRFAAVLAGHTFCGDVEVPGTPRLAVLRDETLAAERIERTTRLFRHAGNTLFVTCGAGYGFVPARFAAPPELALVTLVRLPDPRAEEPAAMSPDPEPAPTADP